MQLRCLCGENDAYGITLRRRLAIPWLGLAIRRLRAVLAGSRRGLLAIWRSLRGLLPIRDTSGRLLPIRRARRGWLPV